MAWPPPVLATDKLDSTNQQTDHKNHHNAMALAINDLVTRVGGHELVTPWTPTVSQGASGNIGKTVNYGKSIRIGNFVFAMCYLGFTGSGAASAAIGVSMPYPSATNQSGVCGGWFHDASTNTRYIFAGHPNNTTSMGFVHDTSAGDGFGVVPNIAIASADSIWMWMAFEATP